MKKEKLSAGAILGQLFALIWRIDRAYFAVLLVGAAAQAGSGLLMLYIPKVLIEGVQQGWRFDRFLPVIAGIIGIRYLLLQLTAWAKRQDEFHQRMLGHKFPQVFAEKTMRMRYADLEDPAVLDLKERALFPVVSYGAVSQLLESLIEVLTGAFTLIGVVALLLAFSPLFTGVILILTVLSLIQGLRVMKRMKTVYEQIIPVNRRFGYYIDASMGADFQKDFRLFGLQDVMERKVTSYMAEINTWLRDVYVYQANGMTFQAVLTALLRFVTWGYVALRTAGTGFGPQISLGSFAVLVGAAETFSRSFESTVRSGFNLIQTLSYLEPFCHFMRRPEAAEKKTGILPDPLEALEFEGVTFSYPKTDRVILDNISFKIGRGERISIVGLNQAGKTTLIKLICRLFEPDAGRILWNGTDISDLDYNAYMDALSCVFQDFQLFPFTIRENVDTGAADTDETLYALLEEVGIKDAVTKLPHGLDTGLDKSLFEHATDFSGGQKQKLAIARAINKQAELVILDEPTAALDPLAESEVYAQFHELTCGRTALFISHRMSSSLFCDKILLLQDGRVAAFDTHKNLMRSHNLYRTLFETQAAHYRSKSA